MGACGCTKGGEHYMFSPVVCLISIWTVLAFAAAEDYEIGQIDIKVAYLNRELTKDEIIHMRQAPGYEVKSTEGKSLVCHLRSHYMG